MSDPLAGAFYISGAMQVLSTVNTYQYCYLCKQGAIFSVIGTLLMSDTGSTFSQNAALIGGVIYAENTPVTLIGTTITESYAYQGGVFYFYDKSPLSV